MDGTGIPNIFFRGSNTQLVEVITIIVMKTKQNIFIMYQTQF